MEGAEESTELWQQPVLCIGGKYLSQPISILTKYFLATRTSGQSYKHFTLINYDSRVVIWGIFQSGL